MNHPSKRKPPRRDVPHPVPLCLKAFKRLLLQTHFRHTLQNAQFGFYDRIFTPAVTLWCMIFQRLSSDHSLHGSVAHLRSGGADQLARDKTRPPSRKIKSCASSAFSKARKRLPLDLLSGLLHAHVRDVWSDLGNEGKWRGLRVLLLDGSLITLRPHPGVTRHLSASSNDRGQYYWVMMRVVATFCAHTGMAVASAAGSTTTSEQALAIGQINSDTTGFLYLGDRNFGVRQMVQAVRDARSHCLFRMVGYRARKLASGGALLQRPGDYPISWIPSLSDRKYKKCSPEPIPGRLIVARYSRPGFRTRWIYLFTTLMDATRYPAKALVELYAVRWQVEINLRHLKTEMNLDTLDVKSRDMAQKEWLAGLMAYNLVRLTMCAAAPPNPEIMKSSLSFSDARRVLLFWLLSNDLCHPFQRSFATMLNSIAKAKLPARKKPRPPEPRASRHKRESFPPLRGDRALARQELAEINMKC